ncbi:hypothetical protein TNCT_68931 [Trichonephila clavata]|uniref:Uncharacterized protein n=1 Tax=Trichonephila clavata TaxID=2740835 RepID=A0A8X6JM21_TRICU|nr:hypothetical protein TNCT_68931 [Trichonephila clavata]
MNETDVMRIEMRKIVMKLSDKTESLRKSVEHFQNKTYMVYDKKLLLNSTLENHFVSARISVKETKSILKKKVIFESSLSSYRKRILNYLHELNLMIIDLLRNIRCDTSPNMEKKWWLELIEKVRVHHILLNSFLNRCFEMIEEFFTFVDELDSQYHLSTAGSEMS